DEVIEQVPVLLQHITERRFRAGNAQDLIFGKWVDGRQVGKIRQLLEGRSQTRFHNAVHQLWRRRFQTQRLDRAMAGYMDWVVQSILDVAVQRWHEAVP